MHLMKQQLGAQCATTFFMQIYTGKNKCSEHRKTNRLHHIVYMCVFVYVSLFHPQVQGLLGLVANHLKFQSNSHSVAVPGCDNTQTHITAVVVSLCWLFIVFAV